MTPVTTLHAAQGVSGLSAMLPLCVDLDGTLVRTDTLVESLLVLFKRNPLWAIVAAPGWLLRGGKARLKEEVAARVDLDVSVLPYDERLLGYLREQKAAGRRLVLVTAADRDIATKIAAHTGLFDEVLASGAGVNLSGSSKARLLSERFGRGGFAYAGNAEVDRKVWAEAGEVILVNAPPKLRRKVAQEHPALGPEFAPAPVSAAVWLRAMRLHQWVKNVLLFVPFLAAHQWTRPGAWLAETVAFLAFGLCASSVYLLNDLMDLDSDRHHPSKKKRALASGALPLTWGIGATAVFLGGGLTLAACVNGGYLVALLIYCAMTLAYSLWLKRAELVDVLALAGLYTIRLVAGGAAVNVQLSAWLLAFSMFIFLSLALVKRFNEIESLKKQNLGAAKGRGYRVDDAEPVASMGVASGYIAVLVLALYVNSAEVRELYGRPQLLWALCPLVFYWVSRIWLLTHREEMHEDPVVFALKDWRSYLLALAGAIALLLARPI